MESTNDDQVIQQIKSGGKEREDAIKSLYKDYKMPLLYYIIKKGGQLEDAKEVLQDTIYAFVSYVKADKFQGKTSIKNFLYKIMYRKWLNMVKKSSPFIYGSEDIVDEDGSEEEVSKCIEEHETKKQVLAIIKKHTDEKCLTILNDFYYDDLTLKEIKDKMEDRFTRVGSVKTTKKRCLDCLITILKQDQILYDRLYKLLKSA